MNDNYNQYSPSRGLPNLLSSLTSLYSSKVHHTLSESNFLVTQGANHAISLIFDTFLEEGDEVILIEPFFDIYRPAIELYKILI